jgi:hypothetical protein
MTTFRILRRSLLLAALALAPALSMAGACPGLKSGSYAVLNPLDADPAWRVNLVDIDADTLVVTDRAGSVQLTATADKCRYTTPEGTQLMVSRRGVLVLRGGDAIGQPFWAVGLPVQALTLKQIAGTWNVAQQETTDTISYSTNAVATINAKGAFSWGSCDVRGANCDDPSKRGTLSPNAEGGFNLRFNKSEGKGLQRFFGLRLTDGSRLLLGVGIDHRMLVVMTAQQALSLPALGETEARWETSHSGVASFGVVTPSTYEVVGVDAVAGSYQRKRLENCRVDALKVNDGHTGVAFRAAGTYVDCNDGVTRSFGNVLFMPAGSLGFGTFTSAPGSTGLYVVRP